MEQRQSPAEAMPNPQISSPEVQVPLEVGQPIPSERLSELGNEAIEQRRSHQIESSGQPAPQVPILPIPVVADDTGAVTQQSEDASLPIVAADEDLIEKEWVAKAKEVIAATKDDPFRREQEVKKLQLEYVRRRYGREIGDNDA